MASRADGPEVTPESADAAAERPRSRSRGRSGGRVPLCPLEGLPRTPYERAVHLQMGCDLVQDSIDQISKLNKVLQVVVEMQNHFERKADSVVREMKELQDAVTAEHAALERARDS